MLERKLLVNGALVDGDESIAVINPASGAVYIKVPRASLRQMEAAISAAKAAYPAWAALAIADRRDRVNALADALVARHDAFAHALVEEQGKPLDEARGEVDLSESVLRCLTAIDLPVEIAHEDADFRMEIHRRPLGVVVGIVPWNFPLLLMATKLASALLAGNSFVGKPAPTTPVTALMLGALCQTIFPAGVVNMLVDQNDLGPALTRHPDVAKISFTGSTVTGKTVAASAGASIKRLSLELGGNDAAIVMDDVDVDAVAPKIFDAAFLNAGQGCICIKRVYAQDAIYDRLTDALADLAKAAVIGDGMQQGTRIGPLQNGTQFEKALTFLGYAHRDGTVVAGGSALDRSGYFVQPTIVRDIQDSSPLVQEEQFSPILPVLRFTEAADAVARANATAFGLGGSIWTSDTARAKALAQQLEAGTVWINHHLHVHPGVAFGGAKESGIGAEYGIDGLKHYTQATVIHVAK